MSTLNLLVIDDEPAARQILVETLRKAGFPVEAAADAATARARLARGDIDVALCDVQLPDGSGIDILRHSRESGLETVFVMVTAFASVETAVEALRSGAYDYIIKPVRHVELLHRLSQIQAVSGLREENQALRRAARDGRPICALHSAPMRAVERLVDKVAPTDSTVLVTGETGTGKSVLVRMIHDKSQRRDHPFLTVNCGAIPDQLLESEFFGNTKGAFTGADRARKGLFLEAERGTLFLDEISELPAHMQTKVLHAIEDKIVRPLGSGQARHVDVRIIAATNRDLSVLVARNEFREDLYFRLSMFQITLPPLRERPDDVRELIAFALRANQRNRGNVQPYLLEPEAEQVLLAHAWPGNVREIENVINRACILVEGQHITTGELPVELVRAASRQVPTAHAATLRNQIQDHEARIVQKAIRDADGDRRLAAQRLGISLSSLYAKAGARDEALLPEPAAGPAPDVPQRSRM